MNRKPLGITFAAFLLSGCQNSDTAPSLIKSNLIQGENYLYAVRFGDDSFFSLPLQTDGPLAEKDIQSLSVGEKKIDSFSLVPSKGKENRYALNFHVGEEEKIEEVKISRGNKEYSFPVDLTILEENARYQSAYSFRLIDQQRKDYHGLKQYSLSYYLRVGEDITLSLTHSLNLNLPYRKGTVDIFSDDERVSHTKESAQLEKDRRYILRFTFDETVSCLYFDEFLPLCLQDESGEEKYILPSTELSRDDYSSPVLDLVA